VQHTPVSDAGSRRDFLAVAACCSAVALGVLVQAVPMARAGCCLTPDAVGYLATAHNWLAGAGFVDPILFTYYLPDARPPVPAFAVRPPGLSLLLAPVLAMGVGVPGVLVWHAVFASLVGAAAVLVARRAMSLPAATAFGIAVTWSPAWMFVAPKPLTEVAAVAVLLVAVASLRAGIRSWRGALLFALLTLIGWLVRPNLALILPATALAVACDVGPRAALRSRPLWVYAGAFILLHRAVVWSVGAATGFAPYAHYGVMAEIIDTPEVFHYRKEYVGWLAYLQGNAGAVLESLRSNLRASGDLLFRRDFYLWVGWLAAPGLAFALLRPGRGSLERRFAVFATLGFTAVALATYGGFVGERYLLLGAVCAWFAVLSLGSAASEWLARRTGGRLRPAVAWLPLLLVLAVFALRDASRPLPDPWRGWQAQGDRYRPVCRLVDPDALVASENPWWFYLWCGNAGWRVPIDLTGEADLHRYLDERQPGYVLAPLGPRWELLARSPRLARIGTLPRGERGPDLGLYEVIGAGPASRPWRAPPPLGSKLPATAGHRARRPARDPIRRDRR